MTIGAMATGSTVWAGHDAGTQAGQIEAGEFGIGEDGDEHARHAI